MLVAMVAAGACASLLPGLTADAFAAEPRGYEMVSPPQKSNGGVIVGQHAADDGSAVAFMMNAATGPRDGAYAVAPYVSYRNENGWSTYGGAPPIRTEHRAIAEVGAYIRDATPDFRRLFLYTNDPLDPVDQEPMADGLVSMGWDVYDFDPVTQQSTWLSRPEADVLPAFRAGGDPAGTNHLGRSLDGRHVVFMTTKRLVASAPAVQTIYESVDGIARQVSILPNGTPVAASSRGPIANVPLWSRTPGGTTISEDGTRIVWMTGSHLYLRENGTTTIPVSASQRTGAVGTMANATFIGMTPDAHAIFFASATQLTDDAPTGASFYRYTVDDARLTYLGPIRSPSALSRPYTPQISESGERVYFNSTSGDNAPGGVTGMRNVYLSEGGVTRFVAATTAASPFADFRLRATRDGSYAIFTSMRSIGPDFDALHREGVNEIYRYEAATGDIVCVSCRTDGRPSDNNAELRSSILRYSVLAPQELAEPRNLLEDGRVYFQTTEPLVAHDSNGDSDVYEWDEGTITLITPGTGNGHELIDTSADGSSVFFMTAEALVGADFDGGYPDVYVAREGGGFPEPPPLGPGCQGDNCQESPSIAPRLDAPASSLVTPDDLADDPEPTETSLRPIRPNASQARAFARSGTVALRVRVGGPGSVLVTASGRIGRRNRSLGRGWARASKSGTVRVVIPLSTAARRQLAGGRRLRVTLAVAHSATDTTRQVVLNLRRSAGRARARRGARRSAADGNGW